jgi:OOP family OmpA-OmpF porin
MLSTTIGNGVADQGMTSVPISSLDDPVFRVESRRGRLLLGGTTSSAMHEAGLLRLATNHFNAIETRTDFRPGVIVSDNWETASSRLLYALAATRSAQAVMRDDRIEIRGVTSDAGTFAARINFLRQGLLADTAIVADVVTVEPRASHDAMCERAFTQLFLETVSVTQSGAGIRTASYSTLDRIIEFAHDCPQPMIAVTGHTDASGDENWNRRLSLARAQAVADYIADRGIDRRRLLVLGRGSAEPVADNGTAQGRSQNRRIEFSLQ